MAKAVRTNRGGGRGRTSGGRGMRTGPQNATGPRAKTGTCVKRKRS